MKKTIAFYSIIALIGLGLVAFIVYRLTQPSPPPTKDLAFKEWSLLPKQKLVIAEIKGTAQIHYEYQKWEVFEKLGKYSKYAPGAKSVDAEGNIEVVVGYDSTTSLLSPDATAEPVTRGDTLFFLVKTRFPEPTVLYTSVKTFTETHKSLISGKISDDEFFGFVDSATRADGTEIIRDERPRLMASYTAMTASLLEQFFKKLHPGENVIIRVQVDGGEVLPPSTDPKRISKNISISKKIRG